MEELDKNAKAAEDFKDGKNKATQSAQKEVEKELAEKSAQNKQKGGKNVKLSLTNNEGVEVIKDGKYLKKGTFLKNVSEKALLIYRKKGLIK